MVNVTKESKIAVADKRWWHWSHGISPSLLLFYLIRSAAFASFIKTILGCDLVQHYLLWIDLVHANANSLPSFVPQIYV